MSFPCSIRPMIEFIFIRKILRDANVVVMVNDFFFQKKKEEMIFQSKKGRRVEPAKQPHPLAPANPTAMYRFKYSSFVSLSLSSAIQSKSKYSNMLHTYTALCITSGL